MKTVDQNPGNSLPSGKGEGSKLKSEERKPEKKARKSKKKANGSTSWNASIESLMEEVLSANRELFALAEKLSETAERLEEMSRSREHPSAKPAFGRREIAKLRVLTHFWNKMSNLNLECKRDQKKLDKVLSQYKAALKKSSEDTGIIRAKPN